MRTRATATALWIALPAWIALAPAWGAETAPAATDEPKFSTAQIEEMVSPIALYPDPLLAQVLMASTYPLEVVEADRWRRQNKDLKDAALDKALESKDWDPSVEGLTHFPDLLQRMSENLDWTKDLGDAFLGQRDDVMDAVQRMRRYALDAGTLKTMMDDVDRVQRALAKRANDIPAAQYIDAKRFLSDFSDALKALSRPDAANFFNRKFAARGKTVPELVENMTRQGLTFAPAVPGDESAYIALQRALANFVQDLRPQGGEQKP